MNVLTCKRSNLTTVILSFMTDRLDIKLNPVLEADAILYCEDKISYKPEKNIFDL
jgi:hypothetical protein